MANRWGESGNWQIFFFLGSKITVDGDCSNGINGHLLLRKLDKSRQCISSRDFALLTKLCKVKAMVIAVVMYGYESWTIKKAECQRIDAFKLWYWRRLFRIPWTVRRSNQSSFKNQPWILIGSWSSKTLATWCIVKDHDTWKEWGQEEKGATGDEMVGWHHQFNGHEFEQTLGDSEGQGSLVGCSPWGHKESDVI